MEETNNEEIEKVIDTTDKRSSLNLQQFMNDMKLLGEQVNDKDLNKPTFHYGDLAITNYLLWLLLGEMMILNNGINNVEGEVEDE